MSQNRGDKFGRCSAWGHDSNWFKADVAGAAFSTMRRQRRGEQEHSNTGERVVQCSLMEGPERACSSSCNVDVQKMQQQTHSVDEQASNCFGSTAIDRSQEIRVAGAALTLTLAGHTQTKAMQQRAWLLVGLVCVILWTRVSGQCTLPSDAACPSDCSSCNKQLFECTGVVPCGQNEGLFMATSFALGAVQSPRTGVLRAV